MSDRLTIEEAATRLGVSARTVYRRIAAGDLRTVEEAGRQWVIVDATQAPPETPGMQRLQHAADRAMFDKLSDSDRHLTDNLSQDLRATIERLEAERDHLRRANDKLTDTVSKLADNVSELNRTLQGQTIRLAQLEGRVLAPETPREQPQASTHADTPPRRRLTLRDRYRRWRRGR